MNPNDEPMTFQHIIDLLEQRERQLFAQSRPAAYSHQKGYDDSELLVMFGPYLLQGDTEGLSPREVRLLETIRDQNSEIAELRQQLQSTELCSVNALQGEAVFSSADATVSEDAKAATTFTIDVYGYETK